VIVHQRLGNAVLLLGLVGTVWAVENVVRRRVSPGLRAYLVLTWLVVLVQALIGLVLVAGGHRPSEGLHWLYGAALLLSLPVAWSNATHGGPRREALAMLAGALAVLLLSIRSIGTG
jgi:heme A synthase